MEITEEAKFMFYYFISKCVYGETNDGQDLILVSDVFPIFEKFCKGELKYGDSE